MLTVPSAGSADVWWLDITSVSVGRAELAELSLEEHKRAAAFAFRAARRRYTAAHVMLRRVLSGYLDFPPSSLVFHREPCPRCGKQTGRPALPLRFGVHFSLAHSGDAVLIAVASQQVGVDVEQQPTGCVCSMSADMNAADAEWGRSLSEAGRHDLVIRWWVRSEAVLKCTGEGIGHEVGEFPVLGRPGAPNGLAGPGGPDQLVPAIAVHGASLISLPAPPRSAEHVTSEDSGVSGLRPGPVARLRHLVRRRGGGPARPGFRGHLLQPRSDPQDQGAARPGHPDAGVLRLRTRREPADPGSRPVGRGPRRRPGDPGRGGRRAGVQEPPAVETGTGGPAQLAPHALRPGGPDRLAGLRGGRGHADHQRGRPVLARRRDDRRHRVRTDQQLGPARRDQALTSGATGAQGARYGYLCAARVASKGLQRRG